MKHQKINSDQDQFSMAQKKIQSRSTSGSGAIGQSWVQMQFYRQSLLHGHSSMNKKIHRRTWSDGGKVISTRANLWSGIGAPNNTPNTYNQLTKMNNASTSADSSSKFKAGAFNKHQK